MGSLLSVEASPGVAGRHCAAARSSMTIPAREGTSSRGGRSVRACRAPLAPRARGAAAPLALGAGHEPARPGLRGRHHPSLCQLRRDRPSPAEPPDGRAAGSGARRAAPRAQRAAPGRRLRAAVLPRATDQPAAGAGGSGARVDARPARALPAVVMDRGWNLQRTNDGAGRCSAASSPPTRCRPPPTCCGW